MHIPQLIERKRDGGELTSEEIREIVRRFTVGELPDYQMSALAMAIYFADMIPREIAALTAAMRDSGSVFAYPEGTPPKVDKHSTGGIGDKVSLVLAPLLACDGLWVPMVSGRGLGITGGTLDKLESIPGFDVGLPFDQCLRQLDRIGVIMIGQSDSFCPADKKLYALRDVTGTVPSHALIIASIMSKKLAENLDRLVLDVKFGSGAFMKDRDKAQWLAEGLAAAGNQNGVKTSYRMTPMDEPLGRTVGNALEVVEAVEALQGRGPRDLVELTLDLCEQVADSPRATLARWLQDGTAWKKFVALVEAQHGDASALERLAGIHSAPAVIAIPAPRDGTVARVDAGAIGRACVQLGAGRQKASDPVDPAVGVSGLRKVGEPVTQGEPLLHVHARSQQSAEDLLEVFRQAIAIE